MSKEALEQFRTETAAWLEANCPESMRQPTTAAEMLWGSRNLSFISEDQRLWFERMRDKGWLCPAWPEAYGGAGLDKKQARILEEEMQKINARQPQYNLGIWMLAPVLLKYGTEEQKKEFLTPMSRGEMRWCQGFSEPNAGSDLASLKTSAVLEGDEYVINGSKIWTSYGDKSDMMYTLVRTDTSVKQGGISFILIDLQSEGVEVKPIDLINGKSNFCQVFFDNVRVPAFNLIGEVNQGWELAKYLLQHERAAMSKFTEGGVPTHDALDVVKPYLTDENGKAGNVILRDKLAKVLMDQHAFGLTHQRVMQEAMTGKNVDGPGSIMKLVMTEQEVDKYEVIMQARGTDALQWMDESQDMDTQNIPYQWMAAKTVTIAGGTSEVQLNIIAKRVLGLPSA